MEKISPALLTFLLNAAWQVALVAAVASVAAHLLKSAPARYRHSLWVAALVLAIALPLTNFVRLAPARPVPLKSAAAVSGSLAVPQFIDTPGYVSPADVPVGQENKLQAGPHGFAIAQRWAAILAGLYFVLIGCRLVRLLRAWLTTRALVRQARPVELSDALQRVVTRCSRQTSVRDVRILASSSVAAPLTVGFRPAFVVVPEKLLRQTDEAILTSAIGHELVHVRRCDYLLNLLYRLLLVPFWFHPAAALIQRRIDQTRELRCDEMVTDGLLSPTAYARSLVELAGVAQALRSPATIAVGIADADILEERIMTMLKKPSLSAARRALLLSVAALVLAAPCIAASSYALHPNIRPADDSVNPVASPQKPAAASPAVPSAPAAKTVAVTPVIVAQGAKPVTRRSTYGVAYTAEGWEQSPQEGELRMKRKLTEEEALALRQRLSQGGLSEQEGAVLKRKLEERERSLLDQDMSPQEKEARMKREGEERAARAHYLAELSKAARITMQQAIDIATRQQPGTVMESSLMGERRVKVREADGFAHERTTGGPAVLYRIVILYGDDNEPKRAVVLVNGIDGSIVKTETE